MTNRWDSFTNLPVLQSNHEKERSSPVQMGLILFMFILAIFPALRAGLLAENRVANSRLFASTITPTTPAAFHKKINFVHLRRPRTENPPGWEAYDGTAYNEKRGYGWLQEFSDDFGADRGENATIVLPNGTITSPRLLGRLELANWQGTHRENHLQVFRIDLPDGWYRVRCTSVDPNTPLPLVDQRSIKCRAHDSIFAGAHYGAPLKVKGEELVEGANIVEVTEGHLRIVVGDPAYGGWIWSYQGPWYRGWNAWFGKWNNQRYAESWYQKLTRTVDPGFHSLRLNSLEIERIAAPARPSSIVFRDFFNREDGPDINAGVIEIDRWTRTGLHSVDSDRISVQLYMTSLQLIGPRKGKGVVGLVQQRLSPQSETIRYSTRVSLFTGEGSRIHSGIQEAGLLILSEPTMTNEVHSTFVGVAYDRSRMETPGWVMYRVGNGRDGYRTNSEIPDTSLPFKVTEGEYEIIVEHDFADNMLSRIQINGVDISGHWAPPDRRQRISRGWFGIRTLMDAHGSGVRLQQSYWYYRVEADRRSP